MSGLAAGTTYYYKAWNVPPHGRESYSSVLTFTTAASSGGGGSVGAPDAGTDAGSDGGSGGSGSGTCGSSGSAAATTGTTYFLAPASLGGNDANDGLSAAKPWRTPKHAVTCGDTILATPSASYASADFNSGNWGEVSCPSGANVAWLKCESFDGCKVTSAGSPGMYVDQSYWGVQGWEATRPVAPATLASTRRPTSPARRASTT